MTGYKSSKKREEVTVPPPKPLLTLLLMVSMPLGLAGPQGNWVASNSFTVTKFWELASQPGELMSSLVKTTMIGLSPWVYILNIFFIWTFGHLIEQRLGAPRYIVYLLAAIFMPWVITANVLPRFDAQMVAGPFMMMLFMLGTYLLYLPKKPFKPVDWTKPQWKIFRDDEPPPAFRAQWVSPWVYITAFAIYLGITQYAMTHTVDDVVELTKLDFMSKLFPAVFGKSSTAVNAFLILPGLISMIAGAITAFVLETIRFTKSVRRAGGNMQLAVLQHYRELRALDMTHEQAVEGASRFMAVPLDVARDWITKGMEGVKKNPQEFK